MGDVSLDGALTRIEEGGTSSCCCSPEPLCCCCHCCCWLTSRWLSCLCWRSGCCCCCCSAALFINRCGSVFLCIVKATSGLRLSTQVTSNGASNMLRSRESTCLASGTVGSKVAIQSGKVLGLNGTADGSKECPWAPSWSSRADGKLLTLLLPAALSAFLFCSETRSRQ